jgi:hypothetical protein
MLSRAKHCSNINDCDVLQEVVHNYYTRLLEDTIGARPAGAALDLAMSSLGLTPSNVHAQAKVWLVLGQQQKATAVTL